MVEKKSQPVSRKIFTCQEIEELCREGRARARKSSKSSSSENIAYMDPAVIDFASKTHVTRYVKMELMMLKNTRTAQTPPLCRFDQRIARLNIFKDGTEPQQQEDLDNQQNKAFPPQVPNLTINNWDTKVFDHIQNYHRSLMYPQFNQFKGNFDNQRPSPRTMNPHADRGVSWDDRKQYADLHHEQLPSYPRKNFFDDHNRARDGNYGKNRRVPSSLPFRSAKGNPCSSERYSSYPNNLSTGSVSFNETKSSYDESINKSSDKIDSDNGSKNTSTDKILDEPEPEWFSWPATRHDVIDLHGFDEEDRSADHGSNSRPSSRNEQGRPMFDDFLGYQRPACSNNRRMNSNNPGRSGNYQNANDTVSSTSSFSTQQFRKPLHHSSKMSLSSSNNASFNRSGGFVNSKGSDGANINPFFDMWKIKNGHQENLDFLNWVNNTTKVKSITEIERAMRSANPFGNSSYQQQQFQSVPQFFSNASNIAPTDLNRIMNNPFPPAPHPNNVRLPDFFSSMPRSMPTQEQLQQHTSEIMRNAIMRKKFQDEKKFQK